jgi:CspA family cold shock protein
MLKGRVKNFNRTRGFGFIMPDPSGPDVMFHLKNINHAQTKAEIDNGDWVTYELHHGSRGAFALHTRLAAPFTWIDLPDNCSHRVVVRCDTTGETRVFETRPAAEAWCTRIAEEVLGNVGI